MTSCQLSDQILLWWAEEKGGLERPPEFESWSADSLGLGTFTFLASVLCMQWGKWCLFPGS